MENKKLEKIRNGEISDMDPIYIEIKPKFVAFAKRQFPKLSLDDIEDVYQDTMIAFYGNVKRGLLKTIEHSIESYIIQIGKNKLIELCRKAEKNKSYAAGFAENYLDESEYNHKLDEAVRFIFSKMTEACKQILHLFYYEKRSMDEIALILEYKNADTVKAKKSRCISTFQRNTKTIYDHATGN